VAQFNKLRHNRATFEANRAKPDPSGLPGPDQTNNTLSLIGQAVVQQVPSADRDNVQALIVEELRRLHEGVLARYGLRPSELAAWKTAQSV